MYKRELFTTVLDITHELQLSVTWYRWTKWPVGHISKKTQDPWYEEFVLFYDNSP